MAILTDRKKSLSEMLEGRLREARGLIALLKDEGVDQEFIKAQEQNLWKLTRVLRDLGDGLYGSCEECPAEIEESRLWALPFTKVCRRCNNRRIYAEAERIRHERRPGGHLYLLDTCL